MSEITPVQALQRTSSKSGFPTKFMGIDVIIRDLPPVPRIQISPNFKWCTPEFRARENAEWLKMFGTKEVCYMLGSQMVMSPRHWVMLRNAT